ncbi:hypothetical protein PUR49_07820 [Streptomyces sp. BE147]|uniref:hypothetical protein n=1 Tax=Streptomyces sp. BE147 TaxID=3002524 RepID=UPI002E79DE9F|nr:hypothetical protein [Streptomyces sp. BE147]MEE1736407.1 hypothetical protein [Streptomyces sp. BE147]
MQLRAPTWLLNRRLGRGGLGRGWLVEARARLPRSDLGLLARPEAAGFGRYLNQLLHLGAQKVRGQVPGKAAEVLKEGVYALGRRRGHRGDVVCGRADQAGLLLGAVGAGSRVDVGEQRPNVLGVACGNCGVQVGEEAAADLGLLLQPVPGVRDGGRLLRNNLEAAHRYTEPIKEIRDLQFVGEV